jgi:short-subunit dehydrogenase
MAHVDLQGARILVTGATGGIGEAIARALRERGGELVLSGRRADVLERIAAETGGQPVVADLADRDDVERLLTEAGDIDVLVLNAALPASGSMPEYTVEQIDRAIDVNLRAPVVMAKLAGDAMAARGRGHIVFISSLSGKASNAGSALYSATKFGIRGYSLGLRGDLAARGVGVSCVFPGFISDAGMFVNSGAELQRGVGTKTPDQVAAGVLRAIDGDKAEVDVAPLGLRLGATLSGVAPQLMATIAGKAGGDKLAADIAEGQKSLR